MKPDEPSESSRLYVPSRSTTPVSITSQTTTPAQQGAVANIARNEIDTIYQTDPNHTMPAENTQVITPLVSSPPETPVEEESHATITRDFHANDMYNRTHDDTQLEATADGAWQQYHTAWQSYYQQYFHRYYAGHLQQSNTELEKATAKVKELESHPRELTPEEAMDELRTDLRSRITRSAHKVRKSRHFMPIVAACAVMLIFVFLQYNTIITGYVAAYVSPGATNPSNIIVDPNDSDVVTEDPRLIIPKIAVDTPVIYDNTMGTSADDTNNKQMAAMEKGVAWFGVPGADSHPGQAGNTVLSGHSSNDWLAPGDYKFVFSRLEQLTKGDIIYVNYQGIRYTYAVTNTKVVGPSNVSALYVGTDKPSLTLITCTPIGTALNRLLVFADQVSPDPSAAAKAPSGTGNSSAAMPGNSPSALQKLFGAN